MGRVMTVWRHIEQVDTKVMKWIEARWGCSYAFDSAMITSAKYTPLVILMILVMGSTGFAYPGLRMTAVTSAASAILSAVMVRVLHEPVSRLVRRPRPFDEEPWQPLLWHEPGDSFPSNHAAGGFALAIGAYHLGPYFPLLLGLAIWLAIARAYCGLHHVSDVVVGAIGGSTTGVTFACLQQALFHVT
ncbi:undecaprenyl-diphosphatase [Alicyclobacillus sacchari]|uniref:Undecaprenyl-diphosphatase n=1 Tax=Alicyclobacillus sacchari TaxID=392010 RepID=A0A4R8LPV4_9BACL|nr:phosphatase PAP2 family protein [Alicyclobacillus sacchari]TDY49540.1 undecaprenyl-diphosphatase [Alicyclobacillus sacchari]GMA58605.1 hypothetical protein GCM10025858_31080 [Alicyclobacillus sacchari]